MSKIIIAEDDPMIAEIYKKKFEEAAFEVFIAQTGDQVITLAQKEQPEVILLDLLLPKMNGFDVIEKFKTEYTHLTAKIIVSSNLGQMSDRNKAVSLGADGFLIKSEFTPGNLVKEVCRIMNQFKEGEKNGARLRRRLQEGDQADLDENKKHLLLIEDEEVFLEMFGEKLRQDGFSVTTAGNGTSGIKEALAGDYDLFIVDMIMPGMNGDEIVAKLRMEEKTKSKPIIILSASAGEEPFERAKEIGVDAFFIKTQLVPSDLSRKAEELLTHNT